MPPTLALTDSMGYLNLAAAQAAGWVVTVPTGGLFLTFNEPTEVDGQNPSMLVRENRVFGVGATAFRMSRTFEMAPNSLVGASLAVLRVNTPWFDYVSIAVTTGLGTASHRAESGIAQMTTDGTGVATVTIEKLPGGPYNHVDERYYFANMRLYGDLVGDLPPVAPPSEPAIILFSPEMDWAEPLTEQLEFETTISEFYKGLEKRQGLLSIANKQLSYLVTVDEPKEALLVEALITAGQATRFWVPYWRSASWLTASTVVGQTTLAIDTIAKRYDANHAVMFWQDAFHAEVVDLISVTDSLLTFAPLTAIWNGSGRNRAKVVPVYRGLLAPSIGTDYLERSIKQTRVTFDVLP